MILRHLFHVHSHDQTSIIYTINVRRQFYENNDHEKIFLTGKNSNNFCYLQKNFQELLIYKLLRKSSFNLFYPLVSLACVLASELLKIAVTRMIK